MKTGPRLSESNPGLETEHRNRLDNQPMTKLELDKANQWTKPTNELKRTQQLSIQRIAAKPSKQLGYKLSRNMTNTQLNYWTRQPHENKTRNEINKIQNPANNSVQGNRLGADSG